VSHLTIEEVWKWTEEREKFRVEYAQLWNESGKLSKKMPGKKKTKGGRSSTENVVVVGEGVTILNSNASCKTPAEEEEDLERSRRNLQEDRRDDHDSHSNVCDNEYEQPIDAILCPVAPGVAPPLDCARYWASLIPISMRFAANSKQSYTSLWNLVDWPALVFPVSSNSITHLLLQR